MNSTTTKSKTSNLKKYATLNASIDSNFSISANIMSNLKRLNAVKKKFDQKKMPTTLFKKASLAEDSEVNKSQLPNIQASLGYISKISKEIGIRLNSPFKPNRNLNKSNMETMTLETRPDDYYATVNSNLDTIDDNFKAAKNGSIYYKSSKPPSIKKESKLSVVQGLKIKNLGGFPLNYSSRSSNQKLFPRASPLKTKEYEKALFTNNETTLNAFHRMGSISINNRTIDNDLESTHRKKDSIIKLPLNLKNFKKASIELKKSLNHSNASTQNKFYKVEVSKASYMQSVLAKSQSTRSLIKVDGSSRAHPNMATDMKMKMKRQKTECQRTLEMKQANLKKLNSCDSSDEYESNIKILNKIPNLKEAQKRRKPMHRSMILEFSGKLRLFREFGFDIPAARSKRKRTPENTHLSLKTKKQIKSSKNLLAKLNKLSIGFTPKVTKNTKHRFSIFSNSSVGNPPSSKSVGIVDICELNSNCHSEVDEVSKSDESNKEILDVALANNESNRFRALKFSLIKRSNLFFEQIAASIVKDEKKLMGKLNRKSHKKNNVSKHKLLLDFFKNMFFSEILQPIIFEIKFNYFLSKFKFSNSQLLRRQIRYFSEEYFQEEKLNMEAKRTCNKKVSYWKKKLSYKQNSSFANSNTLFTNFMLKQDQSVSKFSPKALKVKPNAAEYKIKILECKDPNQNATHNLKKKSPPRQLLDLCYLQENRKISSIYLNTNDIGTSKPHTINEASSQKARTNNSLDVSCKNKQCFKSTKLNNYSIFNLLKDKGTINLTSKTEEQVGETSDFNILLNMLNIEREAKYLIENLDKCSQNLDVGYIAGDRADSFSGARRKTFKRMKSNHQMFFQQESLNSVNSEFISFPRKNTSHKEKNRGQQAQDDKENPEVIPSILNTQVELYNKGSFIVNKKAVSSRFSKILTLSKRASKHNINDIAEVNAESS